MAERVGGEFGVGAVTVNAKLREIMVRSFNETLGIATREAVDNRTAAYLLAVERVADATAMRGLYP